MRATIRRKDIDVARVRKAVEAAERTTSAEIVVSIAPFFLGRVWPAAQRAFARLGVSRTRRSNGVLVFVVPSRRQVVVLADDGALARVDPSVWSETATQIATAFARGHGTTGLVDGIVRWLLGDVAKPDDARAAMRSVLDQAGRLDVLINNAGVFEFVPLEASSEALIRSEFEVNVFGLTYMTQAALPALVASKGAILNISSAAGHRPVPGGSVYAASKAAVESLTLSWALELAPKGVRVNGLAPGPTETPGFDKLPIPSQAVPQVKAQFTAQVPLGRMASPDEVAHWIVAMADPGVTWMTGEILRIDGGMSLT